VPRGHEVRDPAPTDAALKRCVWVMIHEVMYPRSSSHHPQAVGSATPFATRASTPEDVR
jgi:hypothetical protein